MNSNINDMAIGKAGEYLVCADLILAGHTAFPSEQGLSFDVVGVINNKLIRIQVKTTRTTKAMPQRKKYTPSYIFHIGRMGKHGKKSYSVNDVDLFALVALDRRIISYIPANIVKRTMIFRIKEFNGIYHDESGGKKKQEIKQLREQGYTYTQIASMLTVDRSYAHRVVTGKEDKKTYGSYLEDFTLDVAIEKL